MRQSHENYNPVKDVRENVVIATKLMLHGFSVGSVYKTIRKHLEGSFDRLQTDYVDIYYLHRMSGVPVEKVAEAMGRLMEEALNGLTVYGHRGLGGF